MKPRIAFINQRYGEDVVGGSEAYTRQIAERLCQTYEVEVLTTCALDYITWDNYYKEGEEVLNGVLIRRFPTDRSRDFKKFLHLSDILLFPKTALPKDQYDWVYEQGPYAPSLINYIRDHKDDYDVFIFVTYLYYLTFYGIQEVADKAILIPTAHDEPPIHLPIYRTIFNLPRALIFLTEEEKTFVHRTFHNEDIPFDVLGAGVSVPEEGMQSEMAEELTKKPYVAFVGRIEPISKGCQMMLDYFVHYKELHPGDLSLVLMGKSYMDIPESDDIMHVGFVSEMDKFFILKNAKAMVLPSHFESLSIAVLEAFAVRTPVLVNGHSEVLKAHCIKSNAGLYFTNYFEFEGCLSYLLENEGVRRAMGENGYHYVAQWYTWDSITQRLEEMISAFKREGTG